MQSFKIKAILKNKTGDIVKEYVSSDVQILMKCVEGSTEITPIINNYPVLKAND